jgi:hypothetical protein
MRGYFWEYIKKNITEDTVISIHWTNYLMAAARSPAQATMKNKGLA